MVDMCGGSLEITPAKPYQVSEATQRIHSAPPELPAFDFHLRQDRPAFAVPLNAPYFDLEDLAKRGETAAAALCLKSEGWERFGYYGQVVISKLAPGRLQTESGRSLPKFCTISADEITFASNIVVGRVLRLNDNSELVRFSAAERASAYWADQTLAAHLAPGDERALYLYQDSWLKDSSPYAGDFDDTRSDVEYVALDPERLSEEHWRMIGQTRDALDAIAAQPFKHTGALAQLKRLEVIKDYSLAGSVPVAVTA